MNNTMLPLCAAMLIAVVACSKSSKEAPPGPVITPHVFNVIPKLMNVERGSFNTSIKYNRKGLPDTIFNTITDLNDVSALNGYAVFSYEEGLITMTYYSRNPKTGQRSRVVDNEIRYAPDGKFLNKTFLYANGPIPKDTADFIYTNGKLSGMAYRVSQQKQQWEYDAVGNVFFPTKMIEYPDHYTTESFRGEYDNMPNYFSSSRFGDFLYSTIGGQDFLPTELFSRNNPTYSYFKTLNEGRKPGTDINTGMINGVRNHYRYKYVYDEKGMATGNTTEFWVISELRPGGPEGTTSEKTTKRNYTFIR